MRLQLPMVVEVEYVARCEHGCLHCPNNRGTDAAILPADVVQQLIDEGVGAVCIGGGEPLLYPDRLVSDVRRLRGAGVTVVLSTSGTMHDCAAIDVLGKLGVTFRVELFSHVAARHDEIAGTPGAWALAVDLLRWLVWHDLNPVVGVPILRSNHRDVRALCRQARKLGVRIINFLHCPGQGIPPLLARCIYREALDETRCRGMKLLSDFPSMATLEPELGGICPAGRISAHVGVDGTVRPCRYIDLPCGRLLDQSLDSIWSHPSMQTVARVPESCRDCRLEARCGGGCPADARQGGASSRGEAAAGDQCLGLIDPLLVKAFDELLGALRRRQPPPEQNRSTWDGFLHDASAAELLWIRNTCESLWRFLDEPELGNLAAMACHGLGDARGALEILAKLVGKHPRHPAYRHNMGNALLAIGDYEEAAHVYRWLIARGLEFQPGSIADEHNNLGCCLLGMGNPAEAEDHFRTAVSLDRSSAKYSNHLGLALLQQGRAKEALAWVRRSHSASASPRDTARILTNIGVCESLLGLPDATRHFREALVIQPGLRPAKENLAIHLRRLAGGASTAKIERED